MRRKRNIPPESTDEYLVGFFIQVLVLVLHAPDSLMDDLEQAIHMTIEHREELRERLDRLLKDDK